jgi:hypothetical protein
MQKLDKGLDELWYDFHAEYEFGELSDKELSLVIQIVNAAYYHGQNVEARKHDKH